jgi:hypothetical protein
MRQIGPPPLELTLFADECGSGSLENPDVIVRGLLANDRAITPASRRVQRGGHSQRPYAMCRRRCGLRSRQPFGINLRQLPDLLRIGKCELPRKRSLQVGLKELNLPGSRITFSGRSAALPRRSERFDSLGSRNGLNSRSSSVTYPAVVPSENVTINPSSPSRSTFSIRIGSAIGRVYTIARLASCLVLLTLRIPGPG